MLCPLTQYFIKANITVIFDLRCKRTSGHTATWKGSDSSVNTSVSAVWLNREVLQINWCLWESKWFQTYRIRPTLQRFWTVKGILTSHWELSNFILWQILAFCFKSSDMRVNFLKISYGLDILYHTKLKVRDIRLCCTLPYTIATFVDTDCFSLALV